MDPMRGRLPNHLKRSYVVLQPTQSHFREISCQEAECGAFLSGWVTMLDTDVPAQAEAASYIRMKSGRHFTVSQLGSMVSFTFPPGQKCFRQHFANLGRQPIFLERDHQRPAEPTKHNADTWQDSFANHQDKIHTAHERG